MGLSYTFVPHYVLYRTVIQAVAIGQIFKIKILKERPEIIVGYIQGFQKMCGMRAFWSFMM